MPGLYQNWSRRDLTEGRSRLELGNKTNFFFPERRDLKKDEKIKKGEGTELGEESGVKCDRLAQHVLATEGRPVPSATMEDFLSLLLPSPVPSSAGPQPVNPASSVIVARRPFSRNRVTVSAPWSRLGSARLRFASPRLVLPCLASPCHAMPRLALPASPVRQVTCLTARSYRSAENRRREPRDLRRP